MRILQTPDSRAIVLSSHENSCLVSGVQNPAYPIRELRPATQYADPGIFDRMYDVFKDWDCSFAVSCLIGAARHMHKPLQSGLRPDEVIIPADTPRLLNDGRSTVRFLGLLAADRLVDNDMRMLSRYATERPPLEKIMRDAAELDKSQPVDRLIIEPPKAEDYPELFDYLATLVPLP